MSTATISAEQGEKPTDLAALHAPPNSTPTAPPVNTLHTELPFGQLSWENFERLCLRLAQTDSEIEHAFRYGRQGQNQQGVDIVARKPNNRYEVWQAKRYETYTRSDLKKALKRFDEGTFRDRADKLVVAVQASTSDVPLQDEIETQTASLKAANIELVVLGAEQLSERLRMHPRIVHQFFGRNWAVAFLGASFSESISEELDGAEFAHLRAQLSRVYEALFGIHDQGIVSALTNSAPQPSLLERYAMPDVIVQETRWGSSQLMPGAADGSSTQANQSVAETVEQHRRLPLQTWAQEGDFFALVADAGAGKSAFLRCLALDLIGRQERFGALAIRFGDRLPVLVSFARWARQTEKSGRVVGLREIVEQSLQQLLTTANLAELLNRAISQGRILLLVDGLDEWAAEQAARTTLATLLTFAQAHRIPTFVTGRPRGLQRIGQLPHGWRVANLAPLSQTQQRVLVGTWIARTLPSTAPESVLKIQTGRFFRDLGTDPGLLELASNPLLLLGLTAVSLRQHALPRSRHHAMAKVVEILLDEHPERRATAADEVSPRFDVLGDPEVRRSALAALALDSRLEGSHVGQPLVKARKTLSRYLQESENFPSPLATKAANELLAVNAETVGLLIESAPNEVSFAHANIEEFLAAHALQQKSLDELQRFVVERCGIAQWRNVLVFAIEMLQRPQEVDTLLAAIEAEPLDAVAAANRRLLLSSVTFGIARISAPMARKLADHVFLRIDQACWPVERMDHVRNALNGLGNRALGNLVGEHLRRWAPRRNFYTAGIFAELSTWPPADDLLSCLLRGLADEENASRWAAARAISKTFSGDKGAAKRLASLTGPDVTPETASAAVVALGWGWRDEPETTRAGELARLSESPLVQLAGITNRVACNGHDAEDLSALLELLSADSPIDWRDNGIAIETLIAGWPNNDSVVPWCIAATTGEREDDSLNATAAVHYLMSCPPHRSDVRAWLKERLATETPFLEADRMGVWERVVPFALADSALASMVVEFLCKGHTSDLYMCWEVFAQLKDPRLKTRAIEQVRQGKGSSVYWHLRPLLEGWRGDSDVESLVAEIAHWPDSRINDILTLMPKVLADGDQCRARLLAFDVPSSWPRYDSLGAAFAELGCTFTDEAVIGKLLQGVAPDVPAFSALHSLFQHFWQHEAVRKLAKAQLLKSEHLDVLTRRYHDDAELRPLLLGVATSLPSPYRYAILEAARAHAGRHDALASMLDEHAVESETNLCVELTIAHTESLLAQIPPVSADIAALVVRAKSGGIRFERARVSAFAALVLLGEYERVAELVDEAMPLGILTHPWQGSVPSLGPVIGEHWVKLKEHLGDVAARLGRAPQDGWEMLAGHVDEYVEMRSDFVQYCETTAHALRLDGLRALARARPKSDLLEHHIWRTVDNHREESGNLFTAAASVEALRLLSVHFPGRSEVRDRLASGLHDPRVTDARAIGLALYSPQDSEFGSFTFEDDELARMHFDYLTLVHIAAASKDETIFLRILRKMVSRRHIDLWDLQDKMNLVVFDRLAKDENAASAVRACLTAESSPNVWASFPRLLAKAGRLDAATHSLCTKRLQHEFTQDFPNIGFDAVSGERRSVCHSLLDTLAGPVLR